MTKRTPEAGVVTAEVPPQESPFIILNPSKELTLRALETYPLSPEEWEARFFIGNSFFSTTAEDARRVAAMGGVPFTTLRLEDSGNGYMLPHSLEAHYPRTEEPDEVARLISAAIMAGGIYKGLEFYATRGGYENFRDHWIAFIREHDYDITDAELWATNYRTGSHYSKGLAMGAGLKVGFDRRKLELSPNDYRDSLPGEDEQRLKEWFAELKREAEMEKQPK